MNVVGICPALQLPPVSGGVIASGVSGVVIGVGGLVVGVGPIGTHCIPPPGLEPSCPGAPVPGTVHDDGPVPVPPPAGGAAPPVPAGGVVVPVGGVGGVGGFVPAIHARPFGVLVTFPPVFPPGKAQSEPTGPVGAVVAPLLSAVDTQFRLP
jgi:hypothetical protein